MSRRQAKDRVLAALELAVEIGGMLILVLSFWKKKPNRKGK